MNENKTSEEIRMESNDDLAVNLLVLLEIINFTDGIKTPED
jgi:hypothetical protein